MMTLRCASSIDEELSSPSPGRRYARQQVDLANLSKENVRFLAVNFFFPSGRRWTTRQGESDHKERWLEF